jgi:hypothetical protein
MPIKSSTRQKPGLQYCALNIMVLEFDGGGDNGSDLREDDLNTLTTVDFAMRLAGELRRARATIAHLESTRLLRSPRFVSSVTVTGVTVPKSSRLCV